MNFELSNKKSISVINSKKRDLDKLKERFISTRVDKASANNISFVCKR